MHLTLVLGQTCRNALPDWVQERIERNLSDNAARSERIRLAYAEVAGALHGRGLEHIVLKGFAQWPGLIDPRSRVQSDLDLFVPFESASHACEAVASLGYEPSKGFEERPNDHLPSMVRQNGWRWRGNFFDPEMPPSVELHFRFWDKSLLRFGPDCQGEFWLRRMSYQFDGVSFPALDPADSLGFACLHILRHILRDAVLTYHVYELAWFLQSTAHNTAFWSRWQTLHDDQLRRIEAVCFALAFRWFQSDMAEEAEAEVGQLPAAVQQWLQQCGDSCLLTLFQPNKDALWLHVSLLESARDKRATIVEQLMPTHRPPFAAITTQDLTLDGRPRKRRVSRPGAQYLLYVASRVAYHACILPRTLWQGIRLWWAPRNPGKEFWKFYAAAFCFDFGMFIFFFLFNLYLIDRGYTEKLLGPIASALAIGSIAGTLPAGILIQRFGFRQTMVTCFLFTSLLSALRALFVTPASQIGLAFLGGAAMSIWAVCISPAVAQLTNTQNRPFGFSFIFASGIGVGALGGVAGGGLPAWLGRFLPSATPAQLKQAALLVSCGIVALALLPTLRLRFSSSPAPEGKLYPRSAFMFRFLIAIAVWSIVTGALSPFFNVYFAQHLRMPVERIGWVFSSSQLFQVVAVLAAPIVFRKFGLVTGIMYTQLGTAVALGLLAGISGASAAALTYVGYMGLQWMSEPGMYSLLMNQVRPAERSGASALNFLVISISQAVAATAAGASLVRFGYPAVLFAMALMAGFAAFMFRRLLDNTPA
jgi:predicted MFS family arabinose efflux permease